jgi:1,4-alpha-glucan branching enzyme
MLLKRFSCGLFLFFFALVQSNLTAADTTLPTVSFASLRTGDYVGGRFSVTVNAQDDVAIASVGFYKNGALVTNDAAPPFSFELDVNRDLPGSDILIKSEAVDTSGNKSEVSAKITKPGEQLAGPGATPLRNGTFFKVWAPHADRIQLQGDFVGENSSSNSLSKANGWWFGFQPGARAGHRYNFLINDELSRPDPYARAMEHSAGASIIKDPASFRWTDAPWLTPAFENMIIYELHVGTFIGKNDGQPYPGNLKTLITKLDYIKSTGANMIEILPMHEVPGPDSEGTPYLGYSPVGLFAVEAAYSKTNGGSYDDLKEFVNAAHNRGLGVILDVVYNHFSTVNGRDNWYWNYDGAPEGNDGGIYFRGHGTPWGMAPDWERPEVRQYIEDNAKYWLSEFHLDGLRWDFTNQIKDKPNGWDAMRNIVWNIRQQFPSKIIICENLPYERAVVESGNFHSGWWVDFHHKVQAAFQSGENANLDDAKGGINGGDYSHVTKRVIYAMSHDEARNGGSYLVSEFGGRGNWDARAKARAAAALLFMSPGIPMIWQGEEFAQDDWFNDNRDQAVDWRYERDTDGSRMLNLYRDAARTRWGYEVLRKGSLAWTHEDSNNKVLGFRRDWNNESVLVIVNFGPRNFENRSYGVRTGGRDGQWTQILCSQDAAYGGWDNAGNAFYEPWTQEGSIHLNIPKFSVVAMKLK